MRIALHVFLAFMSITLCVAGANASEVNFGDTAKVWSGLKRTPELSNQDQNGVPDLTGGTFTYTNGHTLTSITLNYSNQHYDQSWSRSAWNALEAGDWYFDLDRDNAWDYVIHKPEKVWDFDKNKWQENTQYHLYQTNDMILYSTSTLYDGNGKFAQYEAFYGGTSNRDWHPTTVKDSILPYQYEKRKNGQYVTKSVNMDSGITDLGIVGFDGWDGYSSLAKLSKYAATGSSTWDLSAIGGLDFTQFMGQDILFAYTMTCANDVLYEHTRVPTPEPGTMLLMGAGILGLGYLRKRAKAPR